MKEVDKCGQYDRFRINCEKTSPQSLIRSSTKDVDLAMSPPKFSVIFRGLSRVRSLEHTNAHETETETRDHVMIL